MGRRRFREKWFIVRKSREGALLLVGTKFSLQRMGVREGETENEDRQQVMFVP